MQKIFQLGRLAGDFFLMACFLLTLHKVIMKDAFYWSTLHVHTYDVQIINQKEKHNKKHTRIILYL